MLNSPEQGIAAVCVSPCFVFLGSPLHEKIADGTQEDLERAMEQRLLTPSGACAAPLRNLGAGAEPGLDEPFSGVVSFASWRVGLN